MIRHPSFMILALCFALWGLSCAQNRKAGETCFGTYECTPGLFCAGGTCIVPSGQQGCKVNADCPTSFICRFFVCVDVNTLRACTVSQAASQCTSDQVCSNGYCSVLGEGEPCLGQQCRIGLVCDERSNPPVCRRGRTCETNDDCDNDFVCEQNQCVRERNRAECETTDDCTEGEICNLEGSCEVP